VAEGPDILKHPSPTGSFLKVNHTSNGDRRSNTVVGLSKVRVAIGGNQVIRGIDLRINRGENWVVVGPNGAGKTTLLLLINGYLWPSKGTARILGKRFGDVDLRDLRRSIGLVSPYMDDWFQEERTIDVVASGASASARLWKSPNQAELRRGAALLKLVGCSEHARKRFRELSQGEKRRISIARALMGRPRLITLDEPCAGLDLSGREILLSTLSKIARDGAQTMVYVTHRIEEIPSGFTHALLLRKGKVVGKGELDKVLTGENLSRCFGVKVKVAKLHNRFYAVVDL
jgi:iron complex transport system ATP-binding protein